MIRVARDKLLFDGKSYKCAIGKNGFSALKKEGDGCSPIGVFPLRECWYRADKMATPNTNLPLKIITENDGWCDDPTSPDYNKHIVIPLSLRGKAEAIQKSQNLDVAGLPRYARNEKYFFSHEKLWRDDDLYDLIIPLGYNDSPVIAGKGSAIFMHIAKPNYSSTEGCIALAKHDLFEILPMLTLEICIEIGA